MSLMWVWCLLNVSGSEVSCREDQQVFGSRSEWSCSASCCGENNLQEHEEGPKSKLRVYSWRSATEGPVHAQRSEFTHPSIRCIVNGLQGSSVCCIWENNKIVFRFGDDFKPEFKVHDGRVVQDTVGLFWTFGIESQIWSSVILVQNG